MTFAVFTAPADERPTITIVPPDQTGTALPVLGHSMPVGPGVDLLCDPWDPYRWRLRCDVRTIGQTGPVLLGLVGEAVAGRLREAVRELGGAGGETALVPGEPDSKSGDPGPWLRLGVLESLDRWLGSPRLNQSLVDAERAAAQMAIVEALPQGSSSREEVLTRALREARRASPGLAHYLLDLIDAGIRPPAALSDAVRELVARYSALIKEVRDSDQRVGEPDAVLGSVQQAWHQFSEWPWGEKEVTPGGRPAPAGDLGPGRFRSFLDPRQLPSRLLGLGPEPGTAEVCVDVVGAVPERQLHVRVRAFGPPGSRSLLDDLIAMRLIDVRTGEVVVHGILTQDFTQGFAADGAGIFEGRLPLLDLDPDAVRVDLYDGPGLPAATTEDEAGMHQVRRAVYFLTAWRRLLADVRIDRPGNSPVDRLRAIAMTVRPGRGTAGDGQVSMWPGGPSPMQLQELVDLGNDRLRALLDDEVTVEEIGEVSAGAVAVLRSASGPGALLTAELAAAFEDACTR